MSEIILHCLERILSSEKRRYFLAALIIIALLGIIVFPYIDASFLCFNRIEKRINNLANLISLTDMPLEENEILYEEYLSILTEVKTSREHSLLNTEKVKNTVSDIILKFSGGALLGAAFAVVFVFSKKEEKPQSFMQWLKIFFDASMCLCVGALLGYMFIGIPTIISAEINFALAPIVQIAVLSLIIGPSKPEPKNG